MAAPLIAAGLGAAKAIAGIINSGKAKREAQRLAETRPRLKNSPYLQDQLSLAESDLSSGMSPQAENAYIQQTDRDLSNTLSTILKGGGSLNNVADVFDASSQGRQRLALMKENFRLNKINNLIRAQDANEQFRQQQFQFNEAAPWMDRTQANAQARANASNMIWSGLDTAVGAGMRSFTPNYNQTGTQGPEGVGLSGSAPQGRQISGNLMPTNLPQYQSPATGIDFIDPNLILNR